MVMKINIAWLYAITKYGYPPSIDKILKVFNDIAGLKFRYIELEGVGYHNLDEIYMNKKNILEHAETFGLKIINFCPILPDIVSLDIGRRNKAIKYFEKGVYLAKYFGADMVQVDSFTPPLEFLGEIPYSKAILFNIPFKVKIPIDFKWNIFWRNFIATLNTLAKISYEYGLKLILEPRVGETVSNTDAMLRLIDNIRYDNFGAVLDTGHLYAAKEILPLSVEKLGDRLMYIHVSDNDGRDNRHLALGRGTIDWENLFLTLKKNNYDRYVAIDVGGTGFEGNIDKAVVESKNYLIKLLKKLGITYEI